MSDLEIRYEDYIAVIRRTGAGLNSLKYKERDLIEPYDSTKSDRYQGDVLAPWPNRIRDGKYEYKQVTYQAPVNELSRNNALHGLVNHFLWNVTAHHENEVKLSTNLTESEAYPGNLKIQISYKVSGDGLTIEISSENVGRTASPYGVSIHPYLIADASTRVNDWKLKLLSNQYLKVDSDRLLPIAVEDVPKDFDFAAGKIIGSTFVDHAFLLDTKNISQSITLIAPNGQGVAMKHSSNLKWVQIHTADRDGGNDSRSCLAVEPMTCPPDAFNTGVDLIELQPGEIHTSSWTISAI
jgi:aldose 1-epimerase